MKSVNTPHVVLKDVSKTYRVGRGEIYALRSVSLEVPVGSFLAIMGPSGSGKTTLMNIIGCLDRSSAGEVYFEGRPVAALGDDELAEIRAEKIGFVFQNFNLIPRISALRNVMLPMSFSKAIPKAGREARAKELLEKVGLSERATHSAGELSGGETQRVAIARALANNPSLLLADEPTGSLDSKTGMEIMALFDELNREGKTIIVVTHNLEVARFADRIIHIRDGRITDTT